MMQFLSLLLAGSTNLMDTLDDLPPGIGQYDDFHTIDWLRDIARDRTRHRQISKKKQEGCFEQVKGAHDAWSGWVCVLLVGCAAGKDHTQQLPTKLNVVHRRKVIGSL